MGLVILILSQLQEMKYKTESNKNQPEFKEVIPLKTTWGNRRCPLKNRTTSKTESPTGPIMRCSSRFPVTNFARPS
jgi:hypothetical protein